MLQGTRARTLRRGSAIAGYIGANGGGKTACAVFDSMPSLASGRPVLSTVRLLDWENPRPCDDPACTSPDHERHRAAHPLYIPWDAEHGGWSQLLEVEHCDVIADEITGVASSRESAGLPAVVANALMQLRRRDVVFRWTAPSWARAEKLIREVSQSATVATGYMPVEVPAEDGQPDRAWRQRRLFRWITYDAADLDELTEGKREAMRPWVRQLFWGPGSTVFDAYDTYDAVSTVGHVTETGACVHCGGRRRASECTCPDYRASRPARSGTGAAGPRRGAAPAPPGTDASPVIATTADLAGSAAVSRRSLREPAGAGAGGAPLD